MACTMEDLKKRIESTAVASDGKTQFSRELRRDVLEYSNQQRAAGRSQNDIAGELGMKSWTLNRWHQNERNAASKPGFIEIAPKKRGRPPKTSAAAVVVMPAPAFEVTCPSGFEVRVPAHFEGRSLRELLAVLEGR